MSILSTSRAALVQTSDPDKGDGEWVGLLTISDLNRHAFRSMLYGMLAELESLAADVIETRYAGRDWDWISRLNRDSQVRIVGFWEIQKRAGVDTSAVVGCTITELFTAIANDEALRTELGFASKTKLEDLTGRIPDFRNAVMHPVRPLVLEAADIAKHRKTLDGMIELGSRLHARS